MAHHCGVCGEPGDRYAKSWGPCERCAKHEATLAQLDADLLPWLKDLITLKVESVMRDHTDSGRHDDRGHE